MQAGRREGAATAETAVTSIPSMTGVRLVTVSNVVVSVRNGPTW